MSSETLPPVKEADTTTETLNEFNSLCMVALDAYTRRHRYDGNADEDIFAGARQATSLAVTWNATTTEGIPGLNEAFENVNNEQNNVQTLPRLLQEITASLSTLGTTNGINLEQVQGEIGRISNLVSVESGSTPPGFANFAAFSHWFSTAILEMAFTTPSSRQSAIDTLGGISGILQNVRLMRGDDGQLLEQARIILNPRPQEEELSIVGILNSLGQNAGVRANQLVPYRAVFLSRSELQEHDETIVGFALAEYGLGTDRQAALSANTDLETYVPEESTRGGLCAALIQHFQPNNLASLSAEEQFTRLFGTMRRANLDRKTCSERFRTNFPSISIQPGQLWRAFYPRASSAIEKYMTDNPDYFFSSTQTTNLIGRLKASRSETAAVSFEECPAGAELVGLVSALYPEGRTMQATDLDRLKDRFLDEGRMHEWAGEIARRRNEGLIDTTANESNLTDPMVRTRRHLVHSLAMDIPRNPKDRRQAATAMILSLNQNGFLRPDIRSQLVNSDASPETLHDEVLDSIIDEADARANKLAQQVRTAYDSAISLLANTNHWRQTDINEIYPAIVRRICVQEARETWQRLNGSLPSDQAQRQDIISKVNAFGHRRAQNLIDRSQSGGELIQAAAAEGFKDAALLMLKGALKIIKVPLSYALNRIPFVKAWRKSKPKTTTSSNGVSAKQFIANLNNPQIKLEGGLESLEPILKKANIGLP